MVEEHGPSNCVGCWDSAVEVLSDRHEIWAGHFRSELDLLKEGSLAERIAIASKNAKEIMQHDREVFEDALRAEGLPQKPPEGRAAAAILGSLLQRSKTGLSS